MSGFSTSDPSLPPPNRSRLIAPSVWGGRGDTFDNGLVESIIGLSRKTMLWRIEGLADRFLYFNDDVMLVGPVEPTDFFSHDGKAKLRGRWSNWKEQLDRGNSFNGHNKLLAAEMLGYTSDH